MKQTLQHPVTRHTVTAVGAETIKRWKEKGYVQVDKPIVVKNAEAGK